MRAQRLSRYATALCVAAGMLAGCGRSPIGAPGARPQSHAIAQLAPLKSAGALVYATNGCGGVCVLTYPKGDLVSGIRLSGDREGACSDDEGNVFVTNDTQVVEFFHGATMPIA